MKKTLVCVAILAALVGAGCGGLPTAQDTPPLPGSTDVDGPSSGRASTEQNTNDMPNAGLSYVMPGATQNNNALSTKVSPSRQNTGTGSLVTALILGATPAQSQKQSERLLAMVAEDDELKFLRAEVKWLMEQKEHDAAWQARADAVRAALREATDHVAQRFVKTLPPSMLADFGKLHTLINVGFISGNVGHTERAPTDAEVQTIGTAVPELVKAAALLAGKAKEEDVGRTE